MYGLRSSAVSLCAAAFVGRALDMRSGGRRRLVECLDEARSRLSRGSVSFLLPSDSSRSSSDIAFAAIRVESTQTCGPLGEKTFTFMQLLQLDTDICSRFSRGRSRRPSATAVRARLRTDLVRIRTRGPAIVTSGAYSWRDSHITRRWMSTKVVRAHVARAALFFAPRPPRTP